MPAFFVTGTDTEIGKTTIAAGLLHAARRAGLSTAAAKPVASGCGPRRKACAMATRCVARFAGAGLRAGQPCWPSRRPRPHLAAREAGVERAPHACTRRCARCWRYRPISPWWRAPAVGAPLQGRENLSGAAGAAGGAGGRRAPGPQPCAAQRRARRRPGAGRLANVVDPATSRLEENLATSPSACRRPAWAGYRAWRKPLPRPWPRTSTCGPWASGYKQRAVHNQRRYPAPAKSA